MKAVVLDPNDDLSVKATKALYRMYKANPLMLPQQPSDFELKGNVLLVSNVRGVLARFEVGPNDQLTLLDD